MPKRVSPHQAAELVEQGYVYVDVRSIPEYQQGHPAGARNVPLLHLEGGRMVANPEFMAVIEQRFPKDARLVMGCKSGGRSLQAATLLERAGYTQVVDMRGGFDGEMNQMTGQMAVPGWSREGLPVETETPGGSYEEIKQGQGG
jgi:rhodanese-related sulfurtransferase